MANTIVDTDPASQYTLTVVDDSVYSTKITLSVEQIG